MITESDLDRMEAALARRLGPWITKAAEVIDRELEAARVHALASLTDRAKRARDGRATARRIDRSPSYQAALGHLRSLQDRLCGPSKDSLEGIIRDARASFYRDSIRLWGPHIEPQYRAVADPAPTKAGEDLMRGAIIHGYGLRGELDPAFEMTRTQLTAALNSASRRAVGSTVAQDRVQIWHRQARTRIKSIVARILSDSDKAVHEATGLLMFAPEFRDQLGNPAGDGLHI